MILFDYGYLYAIANLSMYLLSLITFLIGIKSRKKHTEISHLYIYSLASFLQTTSTLFVNPNRYFGNDVCIMINKLAINFFVVIEFFCIYLFFYKSKVVNGIAKKSLHFILLIFLITYFLRLINVKDFVYSITDFYFFDSCMILVPCYIFIFKLFTNPPTLSLLNEPSFWFNAGILIFFTLTLPFFFIIKNLINYQGDLYISIVMTLGYCLVFAFLIRAYLCNPKIVV